MSSVGFSIAVVLGSVVASQPVASDVIFFGPTQPLIFSSELCCKESSSQILPQWAPWLWENYFYVSIYSGHPGLALSESVGNTQEHREAGLLAAYFIQWLLALQERRDGSSLPSGLHYGLTPAPPTDFCFFQQTMVSDLHFLTLMCVIEISADNGVLPTFFNFSLCDRNLSMPFQLEHPSHISISSKWCSTAAIHCTLLPVCSKRLLRCLSPP